MEAWAVDGGVHGGQRQTAVHHRVVSWLSGCGHLTVRVRKTPGGQPVDSRQEANSRAAVWQRSGSR
ncbi:hypothetical protein [Parapedobacter sp. DT-150]|uniref:hypothetical protein n=1 Tax=Parapedobacter sp. DT-150 TaxID=3396162 RepID=UPI003F5408D6